MDQGARRTGFWHSPFGVVVGVLIGVAVVASLCDVARDLAALAEQPPFIPPENVIRPRAGNPYGLRVGIRNPDRRTFQLFGDGNEKNGEPRHSSMSATVGSAKSGWQRFDVGDTLRMNDAALPLGRATLIVPPGIDAELKKASDLKSVEKVKVGYYFRKNLAVTLSMPEGDGSNVPVVESLHAVKVEKGAKRLHVDVGNPWGDAYAWSNASVVEFWSAAGAKLTEKKLTKEEVEFAVKAGSDGAIAWDLTEEVVKELKSNTVDVRISVDVGWKGDPPKPQTMITSAVPVM